MGEFVYYFNNIKMFLLKAFYCIQMNPLCKLYIEPSGKDYQADTDANKQNVIRYRGEAVSVNILCEWNGSEISISTNVVYAKLYQLGINAIFTMNRSQNYLKGVFIFFVGGGGGLVLPKCFIYLRNKMKTNSVSSK